jgi:transposase
MMKTSDQTTKRYTREFKEEAVRLLLTSGKTVKELARELGTTDNSLRNWKAQALRNGDHPELAKPQGIRIDYAVLQQENHRLKNELQTVRQEREILKKSLGIFSRDPLRKGMP